MPSVAENRSHWDGTYGWEQGGAEWSRDWGSVEMQWHGTILPRIHRFLPAATILEIGCGFGRWTAFLKAHCERLIAVDLSYACISACRTRFAASPTVVCLANDGMSLDFVGDASVALAFSFDALPLVDGATMSAYLSQLARVLMPTGAAFLHHSNLGEYARLYRRVRRVPGLERALTAARVLDRNLHWRDATVSARTVRAAAEAAGLRCASQELIRWGTRRVYLDAFSTIVAAGAATTGECRHLKNRWFQEEAAGLRRLGALYAEDTRLTVAVTGQDQ